MKKNMGLADRLIRVVIAVVIITFYFINVQAETLQIILIVLSIIFLITSMIGYCPLYGLLGIKTCPYKAKK